MPRRMLPVNIPVRKPSVMATSTPIATAATEPIRADKAPENQATTHPARATAARRASMTDPRPGGWVTSRAPGHQRDEAQFTLLETGAK